ncbi:SRPBCC family protein [Tautonia plasticadhaerens]|uniref:Polyketide cyclase / dehydrase and lipid transport n=1 Tax=Tautonia plasticadhaerens TaxID=2527974 RepID=A0A518H437_9BACT|nr:SRPBCC family protein [Tautonia plasticadhaerens]QDV35596.1 Polyketide cyclase / dehydrase and lipid transport [Tautonia plasticadhaerens]
MKPITFSCEARLGLTPEEIARLILDLDRWPDFEGYGPLPGIRAAAFEARTPEVVGTVIRVSNTDGSSHTEEVVEWDPERRLRLRMGGFSPPLSRLATGFDETWEFEQGAGLTRVVRSFALHPRSSAGRPFLRLISLLLRRAIARHLRQMKEAGRTDQNPLAPQANEAGRTSGS